MLVLVILDLFMLGFLLVCPYAYEKVRSVSIAILNLALGAISRGLGSTKEFFPNLVSAFDFCRLK